MLMSGWLSKSTELVVSGISPPWLCYGWFEESLLLISDCHCGFRIIHSHSVVGHILGLFKANVFLCFLLYHVQLGFSGTHLYEGLVL